MIQEITNLFSKQYQENVDYLELKSNMKGIIKLRNESESIDLKMENLSAQKYLSTCRIKIGE